MFKPNVCWFLLVKPFFCWWKATVLPPKGVTAASEGAQAHSKEKTWCQNCRKLRWPGETWVKILGNKWFHWFSWFFMRFHWFLWDSIDFHGIEWRKRGISRGIQYSNYKCEKPRGWLSKVLRQPIQWHTHECREIHINNDVCRGYESKLRTLVPVRVRIKTSNSSFFVMHLHLPFVLRMWKSSPNGSRLDIGGIDQIRWIRWCWLSICVCIYICTPCTSISCCLYSSSMF